MKYQTVLLLIYILISVPFASYGEGIVRLLLQESQYDLAQIELYKQYQIADSLSKQKLLPVIAYTYQLENKHLKAKNLYKRSLQNSSQLSSGYIDSIKTNLCYSFLELDEYGNAYGLFNQIEDSIALPVKKRFYILTAEKNHPLKGEVLTPQEEISFNEFAKTLKNPRISRIISAIIPGGGQFYSAHSIDGLQALMVVGSGLLYSTVSYKAYLRGDSGIILPAFTIGVTSLFYYANILSGYKTAIYRNMKLKRDYLIQKNLNTLPFDLVQYSEQ